MSSTLAGPATQVPLPTPTEVMALQAVRDAPAVSVLLSTAPHPHMGTDDAARLRLLLELAHRRLRAEAPDAVRARILGELHALAVASKAARARQAVALYASPGTACWFSLPVPVRDRVVVDPTFATRDLVRSLHRTPRHALLVLTREQAQLYEGADETLLPVSRTRFPMDASAFSTRSAFWRAVDSALGAHLRARPSPVVVVGPEPLTAEFLRRSRASTRVAGTVPGDLLEDGLAVLAERTRPVLNHYLRSREQESLRVLARTPQRKVASGLDAVWLATRSERPDMLVVEEGLFRPARVSDDGDHLLPAPDPEAPDVLEDAVDEVIEAVLRRGGWVALASPGALEAHAGIALTVRDR